jgi:hypothetical protein
MSTIEVGDLLYEYTLKVTGIAEYGVSFETLIAGSVAPPPEGARFDVSLDGHAKGSRLSGRVMGVDYLRVRADGRFLHITRNAAEDGSRIAARRWDAEQRRRRLRENVTSAFQSYPATRLCHEHRGSRKSFISRRVMTPGIRGGTWRARSWSPSRARRPRHEQPRTGR